LYQSRARARSTTALVLFVGLALPLASMARVVEPSMTPVEAIQLAAAAAPDQGIKGRFAFQVKNVGDLRGYVFINSELDYRDQRCLTIELTPKVAEAMQARVGADLRRGLVGKTIEVDGIARRVTIRMGRKPRVVNGKDRNPYYFQTHVGVDDAGQIRVLP
jgi:hypothetical protein